MALIGQQIAETPKVFEIVVSLGAGWRVTQIELPAQGSMLALVRFEHTNLGERYARLDLGKRMFVDDIPGNVDRGGLAIQLVGRATQEP